MENSDSTTALLKDLRVAIVHYWFVGRAGGERVVEALAEIFPQADLYTLVADQSVLAPILQSKSLHTSFLQHFPGARKFHRHLLFLQPIALEQFDLSDYDLVISSESGPAKGVITSSKTCHICYCHSPMRYIWDMYPKYQANMGRVIGSVFAITAHYMRLWDYATASRVDYFVANSKFVASRIRKCYGRESWVIYPPVNTSVENAAIQSGGYYICVGRLVDYKRIDLAIEACTRLGRCLKIIGDGPQYKQLRRSAGPTIEFLGKVTDTDVRTNLAGARALLFPGEEDFGIVPVEAQSFGKPVIAYASGGALETVVGDLHGERAVENATGVFFTKQTSSDLVEAILRFESQQDRFSPQAIRQHSLQFDALVFQKRMKEFICYAISEFRKRN